MSALADALASFHDRGVYTRWARASDRSGARWLLGLSLLAAAPTMGTCAFDAASLAAAGPEAFADVPPMTLRGGVLTSPVPQPYRWETSEGALLLDTTGTATDEERASAIVVLEAERVTVDSPRRPPRTLELAALPDFDIDGPSAWRALLGACVALIPLSIAWEIGARFAAGLLYAAVLARMAKAPLRDGFRVAALMVTPLVLLTLPQRATGWWIPGWGVIGWGVLLVYGERALHALRSSPSKATT